MTDNSIELFWISLFEGEESIGNTGEGLSQIAAEEYAACYNRINRSSNRHAQIQRFCLPIDSSPSVSQTSASLG